MVCTFFGHRQIYKEKGIESALRSALVDLIEGHGVTTFYVGNHGAFDALAAVALVPSRREALIQRLTVRCSALLFTRQWARRRRRAVLGGSGAEPRGRARESAHLRRIIKKHPAVIRRRAFLFVQSSCVVWGVGHFLLRKAPRPTIPAFFFLKTYLISSSSSSSAKTSAGVRWRFSSGLGVMSPALVRAILVSSGPTSS